MFAIDTLLTAGLKILDKVIPDPVQKAEAQQKLLELKQTGELAELNAETQLAMGQIEINKVEASSDNFFKSGWRPFIGWTCGVIFCYNYIIHSLLVTGIVVIDPTFPTSVLPVLAVTEVLPVLFGLLGLGGLRTYEKFTGVSK